MTTTERQSRIDINKLVDPVGYKCEIDYDGPNGLIASTGNLPAEAIQDLVTSVQSSESSDQALQYPLEVLIDQRPKTIDPRSFLIQVEEKVQLQVSGGKIRPRDIINFFIRHGDGKVDRYQDRLKQAEQDGKWDSACCGEGELNGHKFLLFATKFEAFGGSIDSAMGKKYLKTLETARRKKLPILILAASGGVRQQEGTGGLHQMQLMIDATEEFKERTHLPVVAAVIGKCYGGFSAGPFPLADVTLAQEGTDFGFSGPGVIETYQMKKVKKGAQSAENNVVDRNIDLLFRNEGELLEWWGNYLNVVSGRNKDTKKKMTTSDFTSLKIIPRMADSVRFPFGRTGFFNILAQNVARENPDTVRFDKDPSEEPVTVWEKRTEDELYQDFIALSKDPYRVDTAYLMTMLDNPVPLYSAYCVNDKIHYPAIIAAIGTINGVGIMIIGQMHEYYRRASGELGKVPSSPAPSDFASYKRFLEIAQRQKLIVVTHVDTLGAKPTEKAESEGQSRQISTAIAAANRVRTPVFVTISCLGSGGGLTLAPWGEKVVMFSDGMASVAEPASSSAIRVKGIPSPEEVKKQLVALKTTACDQKRLGLIDDIINVPDGEARRFPEKAVERLRGEIVNFIISTQGFDPNKALSERRKKMRKALDKLRGKTKKKEMEP